MSLDVAVSRAKGVTSMGTRTSFMHSFSANFFSSATIAAFFVLLRRTFSFSRRPPPPLMRLSLPSTWSAPSTTFTTFGLVSGATLSESSCATSWICSEVGTQTASTPLARMSLTITGSSRATVDPLPRPTISPSLMPAASSLPSLSEGEGFSLKSLRSPSWSLSAPASREPP